MLILLILLSCHKPKHNPPKELKWYESPFYDTLKAQLKRQPVLSSKQLKDTLPILYREDKYKQKLPIVLYAEPYRSIGNIGPRFYDSVIVKAVLKNKSKFVFSLPDTIRISCMHYQRSIRTRSIVFLNDVIVEGTHYFRVYESPDKPEYQEYLKWREK